LAGISSSLARSRFRPNGRHPIDFTASVWSPAPTGKFCQERIRATGSPTTISFFLALAGNITTEQRGALAFWHLRASGVFHTDSIVDLLWQNDDGTAAI
jgi:hypothetical protein